MAEGAAVIDRRLSALRAIPPGHGAPQFRNASGAFAPAFFPRTICVFHQDVGSTAEIAVSPRMNFRWLVGHVTSLGVAARSSMRKRRQLDLAL